MTLKERLSLLGQAWRAKSMSSFASAFARGDDSTIASANRLALPYQESAWIYSALNTIADEISGRPVKFYQGEQEYVDTLFADWWSKPALGDPTLSGVPSRLSIADVLHDLAAWAKLEGEFFIVLDDTWLASLPGRNPAGRTPFLIANPRRMQLVVTGGVLEGYRYTDRGGRQVLLVPDQVVAWKAFNPYDEWRGIGAVEAARIAAEGAYYTGTYIRELMRNNGDQGAIVIGKSGPIDTAVREQIVADLRAKRNALRRGVAKDIFLTGDITVDRPKEQSAGADVVATKALSHQEIYVAFGVPPSFAEVKAAYSVGKDSDYYQLIIRTCYPLGLKIAGKLSDVAERQTGRRLTAEVEWDDHPVMREVRSSRIESGLRLWGVGMPMSEVNEYLDLGMRPFPGWEQGYLPFSIVPVDAPSPASQQDPTNDPTLAEDTPQDPAVENLRLLLLARKRRQAPSCHAADTDPFAMFACTCHGGGNVEWKDRPPQEVARWRDYMARRRDSVRGFESAFRRVVMEARSETLANLEALKSAGRAVTKAAASDILFDLKKFKDRFLAAMRKQSTATLQKAGDQFYQELGRDDPFQYPSAEALHFLSVRENKLSDVPDQIFRSVTETLEEGFVGGETHDQLAGRVRSAFNEISGARARRIALTETASAYGAGRDKAMRTAGVKKKSWLTSGNANVRPDHRAANNQTVGIDEPFLVGGEELQFPGDPEGSAENVINCHCVSIAQSE